MKLEQQYLRALKELVDFKVHTALQRNKGIEANNELVQLHIQSLKEKLQAIEELSQMKGIFMPIQYFIRLYPWNEFERHVILLVIEFELDEELTYYSTLLNQNSSMGYITSAMAIATFEFQVNESDVNSMLSEGSLLCQLLFTESVQEENNHYMRLSMDRRMRSFFLNGVMVYSPYSRFMTLYIENEELDELHDEKGILEQLIIASSKSVTGKKTAVCLYGLDGVGKSHYCKHLAKQLNFLIAFLEINNLPSDWNACFSDLKKFVRECFLSQAIPVIKVQCAKDWEQEDVKRVRFILNHLFSQFDIVYLTADTSFAKKRIFPNDVELIQILVDEPSLMIRHKLWRNEAENYIINGQVTFEEIANQFVLTPGKIKEAMRIASLHCSINKRTEMEEEDIRYGCFSLMEQNLNDKAEAVQSVYHWDQLVLPKQQKDQLYCVLHQVKYKHLVYESWGLQKTMAYGRGISVLLYGPPGTGKTMAAQVLAKELGLELYRIQLAGIFSKYIGETEKNLQDIFAQAKRNQMILFFDEADILFSKRTEVKDSNDKYSNMEAAFLLQKLEEYDGVSILATNYFQNFDEAFKRRIQFIIEFPFPDQEGRRTIWEKALPPELPTKEIDLDFLSGFELSGSHIKNIILKSAFLAAAKKEPVDMNIIMQELKQEFEKIGKVLTDEEFGEYYQKDY